MDSTEVFRNGLIQNMLAWQVTLGMRSKMNLHRRTRSESFPLTGRYVVVKVAYIIVSRGEGPWITWIGSGWSAVCITVGSIIAIISSILRRRSEVIGNQK